VTLKQGRNALGAISVKYSFGIATWLHIVMRRMYMFCFIVFLELQSLKMNYLQTLLIPHANPPTANLITKSGMRASPMSPYNTKRRSPEKNPMINATPINHIQSILFLLLVICTSAQRPRRIIHAFTTRMLPSLKALALFTFNHLRRTNVSEREQV
jgi:hypothetical protein